MYIYQNMHHELYYMYYTNAKVIRNMKTSIFLNINRTWQSLLPCDWAKSYLSDLRGVTTWNFNQFGYRKSYFSPLLELPSMIPSSTVMEPFCCAWIWSLEKKRCSLAATHFEKFKCKCQRHEAYSDSSGLHTSHEDSPGEFLCKQKQVLTQATLYCYLLTFCTLAFTFSS